MEAVRIYIAVLFLVTFGLIGKASAKSLRIIGGSDTRPGEFPWVVSVRTLPLSGDRKHGTKSLCVGAVMDQSHIITAAHCVYGLDNSDIQIVAGAYNISKNETTQQKVNVRGIFIHPEFQEYDGTLYNDIAIVRTDNLTYTSYVQPVHLPPKDHEPSGDCWVTGWGQTSSSTGTDVLQKGLVGVVNTTRCSEIYPSRFDRRIHVCAGRDGVDACLYDSGGPLLCEDLGSIYIAGIVSWGYGCALAEYPGVYTRIPIYVDWVISFQRSNNNIDTPRSKSLENAT